MPEPDYVLDIRGISDDASPAPAFGPLPRPWVGIKFDCCGVYTRVYRNRDDTAYTGHCPKCLRKIRLAVGPGGTDARFFAAE
jgi:hypothetical protein